MSSLNGFRAMQRTYPIQIHQADLSGCNDYQIRHERYRGTETKTIAWRVSEDQIEALLSERDYSRFREGAYRFRVSGMKLADVLQVII